MIIDYLKVPESLGLISAVVFLVLCAASLPLMRVEDLALMCGALLTITASAFLGFADDVLNLKWRHKLWAPGIFDFENLSKFLFNSHAEGNKEKYAVLINGLWS